LLGSVTAEGLVEVNGQIEGEIHCTSLIISRKAHVAGKIQAERVIVDSAVEGHEDNLKIRNAERKRSGSKRALR